MSLITLPPQTPIYTNPVHVEDSWMLTPGRSYVPVYADTVMSKNLNFYLLYEARVGTIVSIHKKDLPIKNWLLCDGSTMPKTNYEMLYNIIRGMFGIYDDNSFVLPGFKYNDEIADSDIVYIIKYYKHIPGRGGLQTSNTDEQYYYVAADSNDDNPHYLNTKIAEMFGVQKNHVDLVDNNSDRNGNMLYYYGTKNGKLGYWPFIFVQDTKGNGDSNGS